MPHRPYIDLLIVSAIILGLLILLRPSLLTKSALLRYLSGAILLTLGLLHLVGISLLSIRFL
ncbi:MAG TPA: hypothetical protein VFK12_06160 [Gammaproteobacteria bacterium]|jgi:hypothetical protein|nr:hypothetical protein [Gammaproteobacteria bacterium]